MAPPRSKEKHNIQAIFNTFIYAEVFSAPLKKQQIWDFLIVQKPIKKSTFEDTFRFVKRQLMQKKNWYCLPGNETLLQSIHEEEKEAKRKILFAHQILQFVSACPTIMLLGISGNVATGTAKADDDIDIFVVTKNNTLWITRSLLLLYLLLRGKLRRRTTKEVKDSFCLNMFVTEKAMQIPIAKQNLYTAHEVMQLYPLFARENTYATFIQENAWISQFLPNSIAAMKRKKPVQTFRREHMLAEYLIQIARFSESFAKHVQVWYMKDHRTKEVISDSSAAFHPKDYTNEVLRLYNNRVKTYETTL